jgi:hypothetical protein
MGVWLGGGEPLLCSNGVCTYTYSGRSWFCAQVVGYLVNEED